MPNRQKAKKLNKKKTGKKAGYPSLNTKNKFQISKKMKLPQMNLYNRSFYP